MNDISAVFVAPSSIASGECMTALSMAVSLQEAGMDVRFLCHRFTASVVASRLGDGHVREMTDDLASNQSLWEATVSKIVPDVIVFGDYPLLFFQSGVAPLADEQWVARLEDLPAALVTLDHLGYAQRAQSIFFGPPHRTFHAASLPAVPERMSILLPCPVHEPAEVDGRRGRPFRGIELPSHTPGIRAERLPAEARSDPGELLVVHLVSRWARLIAEGLNLPFYKFASRLYSHYLRDLPDPVLLVSVNSGDLLDEDVRDPGVRVKNIGSLPPENFGSLLAAADLVVAENPVSRSLGMAACRLRPCAVVRNSYRLREALATADASTAGLIQEMEQERLGAVFPWEVFPIWSPTDLEEVGTFHASTYPTVFRWIEAFGGAATGDQLRRLLCDATARSRLEAQQERYVQRLEELPGPVEALLAAVG